MQVLVIVLLCLIILACSVLQRRSLYERMESPLSYDLVIARYQENLMWLNKIDLSSFRRVIVYNKGDDALDLPKIDKLTVIPLPNVGRCDHTYLHHIIHEYDTLSDVTVFVPGSCDLPYKTLACEHAISNVTKGTSFFNSVTGTESDYFHVLRDFKLDTYSAAHAGNRLREEPLMLSVDRPFGVWYRKYFGYQPIKSVVFMGIFAATKEQIRNRSKDFYMKLIQQVNTHSNPEVGHYIERAWATIFTPPTPEDTSASPSALAMDSTSPTGI